MTVPLVSRRRHGEVTVLTLERPDRRNALSRQLADNLSDAITESLDEGARALVLAATGRVFCAGGDLDDLAQVIAEGPAAASAAVYEHFHRLVRTMRASTAPIVAAITGPALGAGLDLVLHCPLRVMSETATLASTWIRLGLATGMGGAHELVLTLPRAVAYELALTGRAITAQEAHALGLVNAIVAPEDVLDRALELAKQIAGRPADAVRATMRVLDRASTSSLDSQLAYLRDVQGALLASPEFAAAAATARAVKQR